MADRTIVEGEALPYSYGAQHSGNWSQGNVVHSGNANYSSHVNSANFQSVHHAYTGNWGNHNWDPYFHGGYWGHGWGGWWGWGWGWGYPFWFYAWGGYPYGWGGYYADYLCPYGAVYSTGYPAAEYVYAYPEGQNTANFAPSGPADHGNMVPADQPPPVPANPQVAADDGGATANEGLQYYNEARDAFTRGDYRNALRLTGHSAVESPQNPRVHELTSLALFASGEYRGAATEAHAALALGEPADWAHLYAYYNNADRYTEQLRKLEKSVTDAPTSAPGQFLLGYHYLMTDAKDQAKQHFAQAVKLTPNNKLAQHILKQLKAGGAVTPPKLPAQPGDAKAK